MRGAPLRAALAVLTAGLLLGAASAPPAAHAADLTTPSSLTEPPEGRELSGNEAIAIARRHPTIQAELREDSPRARVEAYMKGANRWQVSWFARSQERIEVAQAYVDDRAGRVTEAWRDHQVAWTMARGYEGAFGRKATTWWIWAGLCLLFVAPFVDPRRPRRLLHLDLLVLCGFSVSLAFFNAADIETSVPLAYPLLLYLLARMLWIGLRRRGSRADHEPLRLLVPTTWLAIGVVFLLGFRVGLNVTDSNVIDVGYAGVIGADRIMDGERLYGAFPEDNQHGDTYGPVNYVAYVPFEQALSWSGRWDDLPAAHGAAIAFDLACVALLFLLGRAARGPTLGIALAWAWVAFPFTLYVSNTNANDSLVAALVLAAVLVAALSTSKGAAAGRGALAALAGLTKFAPLGLGPLLLTHRPEGERLRARAVVLFVAAFAAVAAAVLLPVVLRGNGAALWDATIAYQATRGSPFSIWGLWELETLQRIVQVAAAALAVAVALVPRRRDVVGLAALAAAVLIALQLGVTHWFYLYVVWFFPLVMLALLGRHLEPVAGRPRSRPPASAPSSG